MGAGYSKGTYVQVKHIKRVEVDAAIVNDSQDLEPYKPNEYAYMSRRL